MMSFWFDGGHRFRYGIEVVVEVEIEGESEVEDKRQG